MTDKEKFRAEITRIENETNYEPFTDEVLGKRNVCKHLKNFIDHMQENPATNDLDAELDRYIKENGLDGFDTIEEAKSLAHHFANWQREQMMKDAVELTVYDGWEYGIDPDRIPQPTIKYKNKSLKIGDSVKLLIIKED